MDAMVEKALLRQMEITGSYKTPHASKETMQPVICVSQPAPPPRYPNHEYPQSPAQLKKWVQTSNTPQTKKSSKHADLQMLHTPTNPRMHPETVTHPQVQPHKRPKVITNSNSLQQQQRIVETPDKEIQSNQKIKLQT